MQTKFLLEFSEDHVPVSNFRVEFPFASGSIHRFLGKVELRYIEEFGGKAKGYIFIGEGDKLNRLTFALIEGIGYVYIRGKGKVLLKDGKEIKLGSELVQNGLNCLTFL